ncbi:Cof-type HAD-IIB family hydrolase [Metamycoplasma equirhinis]|uniref:Cof-type HAD-IIB family hydrolase n=1 Tax=Metamycoplasma equirhinis TaxID=92402 RepID=A0ABZ0PAH5_9BACT|nr:Cof-type HAD-IIB family hydrolase [Metamycoplasma equirhinis]TPD99425.1 HAD family phosphatase [Metamycoplasma equirhinis]WPB53831.1 Cof-type HAD-IIB family hydrolase [Metamycoplasma equirhinis]BDX52859.1 phosphatase [Metamycoplasma equirhinis]
MAYNKDSDKRRFLFAIDLDGTLLADSSAGTMHEKTESAIKRAVEEGHIVSIITGRPWRSTKPVYERLNLNAIVGNYNGAHIHNPADPFFIPTISYLDLNEVLYILGDEKVKKEITNYAIEGPDWVQLMHRDPNLEKVFGFNQATKFRESINLEKIPLKPTGIVFDARPDTDVLELLTYLKRRYGDLGEFSSWSKGEGLSPVFDITSIGVDKGKVISLMMRYYNIDIEDTVVIGDSYNDLSMYEVGNVGVAPANAEPMIKKKSVVVMKQTNKEGAVGYFIDEFLDNPDKYIKKACEKKALERKNLKTVKADNFYNKDEK